MAGTLEDQHFERDLTAFPRVGTNVLFIGR